MPSLLIQANKGRPTLAGRFETRGFALRRIGEIELADIPDRQVRRSTLRPRPVFLARLEQHSARGMDFDIAACEFEVGPLGSQQDVFRGADAEAGVGAGEGDFLVGGGHGFAALALQADSAAGGVEVGAGFLVGFLAVFGFAVGEDGDAVLDG